MLILAQNAALHLIYFDCYMCSALMWLPLWA